MGKSLLGVGVNQATGDRALELEIQRVARAANGGDHSGPDRHCAQDDAEDCGGAMVNISLPGGKSTAG